MRERAACAALNLCTYRYTAARSTRVERASSSNVQKSKKGSKSNPGLFCFGEFCFTTEGNAYSKRGKSCTPPRARGARGARARDTARRGVRGLNTVRRARATHTLYTLIRITYLLNT